MNVIHTVTNVSGDLLARRNGATDVGAYEAFVPYIQAVGRGEKLKRDLTYEEANRAMHFILKGEATLAQIGAFLIAQRVKGESPDEIRGFVDAAREYFVQPPRPHVDNLLDLAIPYDGKVKTAQLAPAVALVLAAAGVPVLLHGSEGVPTKAGVTAGAVLTALGIRARERSQVVARMVEAVGVGHIDLEQFAPAWHQLLPLRWQFGLRTVLNTMEKLFNPAQAPYQISSVFHASYIQRLREAQTGLRQSWIVQGEEGSVEMASGRRTPIFGSTPAQDLVLDPQRLGVPERERISAAPDVKAHAALNVQALRGEPAPASDQVALTAGVILSLLGLATDVADGFERARKVIETGAAGRQLELARKFQ